MEPGTSTRAGAGVLRRISPTLLTIVLATAACGTSRAATVRTAPEEAYSSDTIGASGTAGADLEGEALSKIGFDETARSELPHSDSPLAATTAKAAGSGDALLRALVDALAENDLDRAATFTTGAANEFLFYLKTAQDCGFSIRTATAKGIVGEPSLAAIGELVIPVDATLMLDGGAERRIEAIQIEDQKRAGWLISDLLIDGRSTLDLVPTPVGGMKRGIRLIPEGVCTGPTSVELRYKLFNEGRDPFLPTEIYFEDPRGQRFEIEGAAELLAEPIPASNAGIIWEIVARVENGYDGGRFVIAATDLDESRQEDREVQVLREYRVNPSPFLSDFDTQDAIAQALGDASLSEQSLPGTPTTSDSSGPAPTPPPETSETTDTGGNDVGGGTDTTVDESSTSNPTNTP